jgi:hypothetical protein
MAVGIQGCDEMFINPETGLCEPSPEHCPPGQIPIFSGDDQGCRVVGIPDCDDMFINPDTGLCDPTPDHCPPGQIPIFSGDDQGCRPVGILDCHPDFIDAETGLCDPDPDFCEAGYIPVPTQGCVSLDPPGGCGEGTWGSVEELAGDVYVDVGYAGGDSDGSREKPWTLIAYALGNTQPGGRMVLAAGVYDEGVLLGKSVSLVGRCSSMVTISGVRVGPVGPTVVEVKGDVDASISDVTISGPGIGMTVHSDARLSLKRAAITDNHDIGLTAAHAGTTVIATDVLIARTQPLPDGTFGRGIAVEMGAQLSLMRGLVTDNHDIGLYTSGAGTSVTAIEVLIARTQPIPNGTWGRGINVEEGAQLTLERAAVTDNHDVGLYAGDAGTTVMATEVLIARTQPSPDGTGGRGISVQLGAQLTLERAALTGNQEVGIHVSQAGSTVTATEVLIARTQPDADGTGGRGIGVQEAAQLTLERAAVTDNHELGLAASGAGSKVMATEVLIARTQPKADGTFGRGIQAQGGVHLTLEHAAITDNHDIGLFADGVGTTVMATEVLIARTQPSPDGRWGRGIGVREGAQLTLERAVLTDNHEAGLVAGGVGATVMATEVLIARTQPDADGTGGWGIGVHEGAQLTLERGLVTDNHDVGLIASDAGTTVTATEVAIARTQPSANGTRGRGISVQEGAQLTLSRGALTDNHEAAILFLWAGGSVTDSLLQGTKLSPANTWGMADGLLVTGSVVTTTGVVARGNARSGILYDRSEGDITSCLITDNAIGLADQGLPGATIGDNNVVTGNEQNFLDDGNLSVPDEAMEIPDIPELD